MDDIIKTLTDGTLDDLRKALPGLTMEQLTALKAAEQAGKKRSGAFDMIDEAIDVLGGAIDGPASTDADTAVGAGASAPEFIAAASPAPPPAGDQSAGDPPASDLSPVDAAPADSARRERIVLVVPSDRRDLLERLRIALAEGDSVAIVLADEDGEMLAVPPIEAKAADFQQFGGAFARLIYMPRVELPVTLPPVAVRQAFLLVKPTALNEIPAVAVCRLSVDLNAGGGRKAEIPDGNLLFSLS